MDMPILINYYLKDKGFASRERRHVPRVGDEIRFQQIVYRVLRVVWIEDQEYPSVAIDIIAVA